MANNLQQHCNVTTNQSMMIHGVFVNGGASSAGVNDPQRILLLVIYQREEAKIECAAGERSGLRDRPSQVGGYNNLKIPQNHATGTQQVYSR